MKKFIIYSMLCLVTGCAYLPFMGPRAPDTAVFFQPGSAQLDASAQSAIAAVAQKAAANPTAALTLTGAADNTGNATAAANLSEQRAQAVENALVADGVAAGRINIVAAGGVAAPSPGSALGARRVTIHFG